MKKWFKKIIPSIPSSPHSHEFRGLKSFLKAPYFWSYEIQYVARGVSAGLAGAVIPGFQMFYAAILVILLRGNFPIALLCTLITNPLTVVPITYFIYFIGKLIIGNNHNDYVVQSFNWDLSSFHAFSTNVSNWIMQFGKAFFVGLPIVSLSLGIIGYFGTIFVWKMYHLLFHKKNK